MYTTACLEGANTASTCSICIVNAERCWRLCNGGTICCVYQQEQQFWYPSYWKKKRKNVSAGFMQSENDRQQPWHQLHASRTVQRDALCWHFQIYAWPLAERDDHKQACNNEHSTIEQRFVVHRTSQQLHTACALPWYFTTHNFDVTRTAPFLPSFAPAKKGERR